MLLAAALAAVLAVVALAGIMPLTEQSGQVIVLNPESYPLVGGIWAVDLEVLEEGGGGVGGVGDLRVAADGGTAFGRDIEFAGMRSGDGASILPAVEGEILHFGAVAAGQWTLEVRVLTDGPHHLRFDLDGQTSYAKNTAAFANITSATANGTYDPGEVVDVRVTFPEPVNLETFRIRDNNNGTNASPFKVLNSTTSVTTITIDSRHYAMATSFHDDGVQIINITDPSNPSAVSSVTDNSTANRTDYTELQGANSVTTTTIQVNGTDRHYALVASFNDDGVQIINITDPSSPSAVVGITDCDTDCTATDYTVLRDASSVTTTTIQVNGTDRHYALVASSHDDGVQIIDITDPSNPTAVTDVTDCKASCTATNYTVLDGAYSVTTITIDSGHYALVASSVDDGVQIINITDPSRPSAVANVTDSTDANPTDYTELDNVYSVTTTTIQVNGTDRHYALVASLTDSGVQIIDITDPSNPSAVASMEDSTGENPTDYTELQGVISVTTTQIGSRHYALVTSLGDDGVQMIDITEPARPLNPLLQYIVLDLVGDRRAAYTGMSDDDRSLVFEYLVRPGDWTLDLAYLGTDALNLERNNLTNAGDSTDLSGVILPEPGRPNSLSYNKDIALSDTTAFVTTWRTTANSDTITVPIGGSGMTVIWGDGQVDRGISAPINHTYATAGDYVVHVTGGLTVFNLNGHQDAPKMISIDQWGNASWTTMENAFRGARNMSYHATDAPDLSGVTDMSSMFYGAASFNGDISGWSVSSATDMTDMFYGADIFAQNLGEWYI